MKYAFPFELTTNSIKIREKLWGVISPKNPGKINGGLKRKDSFIYTRIIRKQDNASRGYLPVPIGGSKLPSRCELTKKETNMKRGKK